MKSEVITNNEAEQALLRSGYLLESRLESLLVESNYIVDANTAYPDPETGKSRELDIKAVRADHVDISEHDYVFPNLVIECVNNLQPLVFITKEPAHDYFLQYDIKMAGLPVKIPCDRDWLSLVDYLGLNTYHHYCQGRYATQYCSFAKKKQNQQWMAWHEEENHDVLTKMVFAVEHLMDEHFRVMAESGIDHVNLELYYPILVVQGNLLEARPSRQSAGLLQTDHVRYRRSTFIKSQELAYQIDVVTEQSFPKYLGMIEEEVSRTVELLGEKKSAVRRALGRMAEQVEKAKKLEEKLEAIWF